ncbi:MAG: hypothetical protein AAGB97_02870 [Dehalococcoidia bacterium]|nr:hypothetical protein [Chloroflexota bacterium]
MKKWWLVISLVVVIAMLGAGGLVAFHGNQQVADYGYGAEVDGDVTAEGDTNLAAEELTLTALTSDVYMPNPEHTKAYEKLFEAIPYMNAQGIPVVDFCRRHCGTDPETGATQIMVILVGLREVRDEYKEAIKAIVEGVDGIEFDFFQAEFTREEIWGWQDKIWGTFSRPWDLPPGIIEVPVSGTSSSWRDQIIGVQLAGEVRPEYIEAIKAVVGNEAPLNFQGGGSVRHHTRYWQEKWDPDEMMEKQVMLHVFALLFPDVELSSMRIGEVEEFIKGLSVEEATELIRKLLDYALERGLVTPLVTPEERQELEEEMLQHWLEWRQE